MDKTNLILNSTIELVDVQEEGNGKGRPFISRFLEPGIAHYKELGDILITKETLNKFIHTMVGCPVIIEHEDVTDENADKLRVGVVSRVWFNEIDGYFYCEGILTDPEAIGLVKNQGYNVSCAYSFVSDNTKKTHNGKEIDMEFIDGEFLHLALVKDPRYEGANIVVNSLVKNAKDWDGNEGDWITVKGNHLFIKKGQSKDEAVKEFLEGKQSDTKDKPEDSGEKGDKNFNWEKLDKDNKYSVIDGLSGEEESFDSYDEAKSFSDKLKKEYKKDGYKNPDINIDEVDKDGEYVRHMPDFDKKEDKSGDGKANNNIGDITMTVLNDLTDFIKKVVKNEKDEEMKEVKNEDKRKLIDEVGGILKGKVDEEVWRTVVGKLEKVAYEPSEDSKADNKDDEEKEAKNKCKNEEDEKKEKIEEKEEKVTENEDEEEDKEDKAENKKVKNSMKDIVMGGSSQAQTQKLYTSRKERLEEGNKY